ncbi:MAG: hypothetical protein RR840_01460 [Clostridium sp.]
MTIDGLLFKEDKTKKVASLANELSSSSKGDIIYISNCNEAKNHLNDNIKFLDLSEIEFLSSRVLASVVEQLSVESVTTEIILIDNLSKMLNESEIEVFLKEVDKISEKSNVKILFGLERENKSSINSLGIEEID